MTTDRLKEIIPRSPQLTRTSQGRRNGVFPQVIVSKPWYISHIKLVHAWTQTGLATVSGGLSISYYSLAPELSLLMVHKQGR